MAEQVAANRECLVIDRFGVPQGRVTEFFDALGKFHELRRVQHVGESKNAEFSEFHWSPSYLFFESRRITLDQPWR